MNRYNVVYVQEISHEVSALSTEAAGRYAKNYAHSKGLKVLSVERTDLKPQNPPVAPRAAD